MKKTKYISYDYLAGKADAFPYTYRMLYMKILDTAPSVEAGSSREDYLRGYEEGLRDGEELHGQQ